MKQRGRKSPGKTVAKVADVTAIPRTPPPADLNPFEVETWVAVVNTKPADWFGADTLPMLRAYVRHVWQAAKIDAEMDVLMEKSFMDITDGGPIGALFESLAKMRDRESRAIMALARSMRLTQQSQVHPETAGTAARKGTRGGGKLWEGG